jgi:hypothetical protein
MSEDTKCELSPVHRALDDAHTLLHQLEESYFDPQGFRLKLNQTLQALRSIYSKLIFRRKLLRDFDAWGKQWTQVTNADPVWRWAIRSRNRVTKEEDLETHSTARVSIVDSYRERTSTDVAVPPSSSAEQVAAAVYKKLVVPSEARDTTIIRVERRWVDSALPEYEILDALHHVLLCHRAVVDSAHDQLPVEAGMPVQEPSPVELPQFVPASVEVRTAYLRLKDMRFTSHKKFEASCSEKSLDEAATRYEFEKVPPILGNSLRDMALGMFEVAKTVLRKDGHHRHFVFLIGPNGIEQIELRAEDKADKFLLWRRVAARVREVKATTVVTIGEAWRATWDGVAPVYDVEALPEKIEVLSLHAASIDGAVVDISASINRAEGGAVELGDSQETMQAVGYGSNLTPIFAVWDEMRKAR